MTQTFRCSSHLFAYSFLGNVMKMVLKFCCMFYISFSKSVILPILKSSKAVSISDYDTIWKSCSIVPLHLVQCRSSHFNTSGDQHFCVLQVSLCLITYSFPLWDIFTSLVSVFLSLILYSLLMCSPLVLFIF